MLSSQTYFYQYLKDSGLTLILNIEPTHNILVNQFIQQFVSYLHYQISTYHLQNKQSYQSHVNAFNDWVQQSIAPTTSLFNKSPIDSVFTHKDDVTLTNLYKKSLLEKTFLKGQSFKDVKQEHNQDQNIAFNHLRLQRLSKDLSKFDLLYWGKSYQNFVSGYIAVHSSYIQFLLTQNTNYQPQIDLLIDQVFNKKIIKTSYNLDLFSTYELEFFNQKQQAYILYLEQSQHPNSIQNHSLIAQYISTEQHNLNQASSLSKLTKTGNETVLTFTDFYSFKDFPIAVDFDIFSKYKLISCCANDNITKQTELENLELKDTKALNTINLDYAITTVNTRYKTELNFTNQQYNYLSTLIAPQLRLNNANFYRYWLEQVKVPKVDTAIQSLWFDTIENFNLYSGLQQHKFSVNSWSEYTTKKALQEFTNLAVQYEKYYKNIEGILSKTLVTDQNFSYYHLMVSYWLDQKHVATNIVKAENKNLINTETNLNANAKANATITTITRSNKTKTSISLSNLDSDFRPQQSIYNHNKRLKTQNNTRSVNGFIEKNFKQSLSSEPNTNNATTNSNKDQLMQTLLADLSSSKNKLKEQSSFAHNKFELKNLQQMVADLVESSQLEFINSFVKLVNDLQQTYDDKFDQLSELDAKVTKFKLYDNSELSCFDSLVVDNANLDHNNQNQPLNFSIQTKKEFNVDYAIYTDVDLSLLSLQTYCQHLTKTPKISQKQNHLPLIIYIASGLTFLYQSIDKSLLETSLISLVRNKLYSYIKTNTLTNVNLELLAIEFNTKAKAIMIEIIKVLNELQYLQQQYQIHILYNLNLFQLAKSLGLSGNEIWKYINLSKFNIININVDTDTKEEHNLKTNSFISSIKSTDNIIKDLNYYLTHQTNIYKLACDNGFDHNYIKHVKDHVNVEKIASYSCMININCQFNQTPATKQLWQSKYYYLTKQIVLMWK